MNQLVEILLILLLIHLTSIMVGVNENYQDFQEYTRPRCRNKHKFQRGDCGCIPERRFGTIMM